MHHARCVGRMLVIFDLAVSGGHGIAGSASFSTVELFAKPVPR